ncbi:MAG TPA: transaldolase [Acidimicrobiales bacterium]|nr:transaldolase [Acidimicrobiales bacterium]
MSSSPLKTKIFADGAAIKEILEFAADKRIRGFTTNPTLMREAGVLDYAEFASELLLHVGDRPISFEVFADEPKEMHRQARIISSWADNVFVKIPITTTKGETLIPLVHDLSSSGVMVNVTAVFTLDQVERATEALSGGAASYISIFAGRIADTGRDPLPIVAEAVEIMKASPDTECIWSSPREVLNLIQANSVGCHIITMTRGLLDKLGTIGKDLDQYSLETVEMFNRDATLAKYSL